MNTKIQVILSLLANFTGMNDTERQKFFTDMYTGLVVNIFSKGKQFTSPNTQEMFAQITKDTGIESIKVTLEEFVKDINKSPEGKLLLLDLYAEFLDTLIEPVKSDLTADQKLELLAVINSTSLS